MRADRSSNQLVTVYREYDGWRSLGRVPVVVRILPCFEAARSITYLHDLIAVIIDLSPDLLDIPITNIYNIIFEYMEFSSDMAYPSTNSENATDNRQDQCR